MPDLISLFLTFAKIGVMTFGGGYAMLPMLTRELVSHRGWTTEEELADYFAVGQCTPGVIAVNTATFIGYKRRGIAGGIVATLGVVFPSLVIILLLAALLSGFADEPAVAHAFAGIRIAVCALILHSVIRLFKKAVVSWKGGLIYAAVLLLSVLLGASPVIFVLAAAAVGIAVQVSGGKPV